jgi:hypothetical protein
MGQCTAGYLSHAHRNRTLDEWLYSSVWRAPLFECRFAFLELEMKMKTKDAEADIFRGSAPLDVKRVGDIHVGSLDTYSDK